MVGALGAGIVGVVCGETVWVANEATFGCELSAVQPDNSRSSGEDGGRKTSGGELLFALL